MKSFLFPIFLCLSFSFLQAQPFKSYVNLQNTVINLPQKLGWKNLGFPVFSDEFDSLYVDTLYRDKVVHNGITTYVPNKNFYLINGKWRWFWATHTWTDQAVYFKFENCVINDTNIVDPANPSNKYMSMFVKHYPDDSLIADEPFHPGENPMFPMKTNYSASMLINGITHNPEYILLINPDFHKYLILIRISQ